MIIKYRTKREATKAIIKLNIEIETLENMIDKINKQILKISYIREQLPEYISGKNTELTETTTAGKQKLIPGTPGRTVPQERIKPRPRQQIAAEPLAELKLATAGQQQFNLI